MKLKKEIAEKLINDFIISIFLYSLPIVCMFIYYWCFSKHRPWNQPNQELPFASLGSVFVNFNTWGLPVLMVVVGVVEWMLGLYKGGWNRNEQFLETLSFIVPRIVIRPIVAYYSLRILPLILPGFMNMFGWMPFWWGFFIIAIGLDLTEYWYHRLHHQIPSLWRFHRAHHSAPYMGMSVAYRSNFIILIFDSPLYLTVALAYLGLGAPVLIFGILRSLISISAHSSLPWDRPFYSKKWLHPMAWIMERVISTPATHHAHHSDNSDDGVGHYKGNFGNMFFIWDMIFGTGIITRKYPSRYGLRSYKQEEWYVQYFWPFIKSKRKGSELSPGGPMVADEEEAVFPEKDAKKLREASS